MLVHHNPYFSIDYSDNYYSINFTAEQVVVLPLIDDNHILFIKSIRPVFTDTVLELPAGSVDKGESLKKAAMRELSEETGISFNDESRIHKLKPLNTIPSRTSQMLNIYHANISIEEFEARKSHDGEVADTLLLSYRQILGKIYSGEIFVATAVAVCLRHIIPSLSKK